MNYSRFSAFANLDLAARVMFSTCPTGRLSVRPSVCYQSCTHDILKTKEPILLQTGESDPRRNQM